MFLIQADFEAKNQTKRNERIVIHAASAQGIRGSIQTKRTMNQIKSNRIRMRPVRGGEGKEYESVVTATSLFCESINFS